MTTDKQTAGETANLIKNFIPALKIKNNNLGIFAVIGEHKKYEFPSEIGFSLTLYNIDRRDLQKDKNMQKEFIKAIRSLSEDELYCLLGLGDLKD